MALPIQTAPKYKTVLPVNKETVEYRPFLVKEQKILVLAQESEDNEQIVESVKQLLRSVTDNKVEPNKLCSVDMEWLFLKVRSVSIGETASVMITCENDSCKTSNKVELNLESAEVEGSLPEDNNVMISDSVGVKLDLPSLKTLSSITNLDASQQLFEILKSSMVMIFDENNVYHCSEVDTEDLDEFVESLTFEQLGKLGSFFDDAPSLTITSNFQCTNCQTNQSKVLRGIQNFF